MKYGVADEMESMKKEPKKKNRKKRTENNHDRKKS